MAENLRRSRRRQSRRRRVVVAVVGTVVIAGGGAAAVAATRDGGAHQAIAMAERATVTQTIESSGTVSSAQKAAPTFSVSGTVKTVAVAVGDKVAKGQVLARLDPTDLRSTVDSDEQTLATAKQQLEADKTGQTSTQTGRSSTALPSGYSVNTASDAITEIAFTETAEPKSSLIEQIDSAQNTVIDAQKRIDSGQADVDTAQKLFDSDVAKNTELRDAQQTACSENSSAPPSTAPSESPTPSESTTPTGTTTPSGTPSSSASPSASPASSSPPISTECATAMAAYEAFADTMKAGSDTLASTIKTQDGYVKDLEPALRTLDKLVDQVQSSAAPGSGTAGKSGSGGPSDGSKTQQSGSGAQGGRSTGTAGKSTGSTPNGNSGGVPGTAGGSSGGHGDSQGSSGTPDESTPQPATAAQLAADQAAIDAAQAELTVGQQNLAQATLTSPISGTVAAVDLTAGSSAGGQTITIVGTGRQDTEVDVPLGQIDLVRKGQPATVKADGVGRTLHGVVDSIGLLAGTSDSNPSYPVTIALDAGSPSLFDGAGADATITAATAKNVLTVPNSAIHADGSRHTVTVLDGGKTTIESVQIGVVGSDRTQIRSGLKAGQKVVLADPSEPLPSSSTTGTSGNSRFTGGGFGGRFAGPGGR